MGMSDEISIYVHWPFCRKKCPYCDFNSHVSKNAIDHARWRKFFAMEIANFYRFFLGKKIKSVFFGGGTPSLMEPATLGFILNELQKISHFKNDIEITMEANPTSIEYHKFKDFKAAGVNRISIGIQSFSQSNLQFLGREHSGIEAMYALKIGEKVFENFSFDLIYVLPNQKINDWLRELKFALCIANLHISLYQLTIEKGTQFFAKHRRGDFVMPKQEIAADFFDQTNDLLESRGLRQYEVSNYAKPGFECQHNVNYWDYGEFLGIGPGAHSRVQVDEKWHSMNTIYHPDLWMKGLVEQGSSVQNFQPLIEKEVLEEMIMMGLRMKNGIELKKLKSFAGIEKLRKKIQVLHENDLLIIENEQMRVKNFLQLNKVTEFLLT